MSWTKYEFAYQVYIGNFATWQSGSDIYEAWAPPGTPTSTAGWLIQRLHTDVTGITRRTNANGQGQFDKVLDNWATYVYDT
jgi:hypothetical protein